MPHTVFAKRSSISNGRPTPYGKKPSISPEVIDLEEDETVECLKRLENKVEKSMQIVSNSVRSLENLLLPTLVRDKNVTATDKGQCEICMPFKINVLLADPNQTLTSKQVEYSGAIWHVAAKKVQQNGEEFLSVFLRCRSLLQTVKYKTSYIIDLIGSKENFSGSSTARCFNEESQSWGWHSFIAWSKFSDYANGFLDNKGNAILLAKFSTTGETLTHFVNLTKFSESAPYKSDCVMLIENHRIEVHKGFLSMYSPLFVKLFNDGFAARSQVEVNDVSVAEVLTLLEVIYPPFVEDEITESNVECLLVMAKRFVVPVVTARCEAYLLKCPPNRISFTKKILLSYTYDLVELQKICINHFASKDEIKKLEQNIQ